MTSLKKAITVILITLLASCEKRISPDELKLGDAPSQYVIEGYVSNRSEPYYVRVSKSANYFAAQKAITIDNAIVVISDDDGNKALLTCKGNGVYETTQFTGQPGRTYYLKVTVGTDVFNASSYMPPKIAIDTLLYVFREETDHGNEEGYFVTTHFSDPSEVSNYYRLKAFRNGRVFNDIDDYIVMADYSFNGETMRKEFPAEYVAGDTAAIELWAIDYASYVFYQSVDQQINVGGSPLMAQPGNIKSNIKGGATGLFCAYAMDKYEVTIKK